MPLAPPVTTATRPSSFCMARMVSHARARLFGNRIIGWGRIRPASVAPPGCGRRRRGAGGRESSRASRSARSRDSGAGSPRAPRPADGSYSVCSVVVRNAQPSTGMSISHGIPVLSAAASGCAAVAITAISPPESRIVDSIVGVLDRRTDLFDRTRHRLRERAHLDAELERHPPRWPTVGVTRRVVPTSLRSMFWLTASPVPRTRSPPCRSCRCPLPARRFLTPRPAPRSRSESWRSRSGSSRFRWFPSGRSGSRFGWSCRFPAPDAATGIGTLSPAKISCSCPLVINRLGPHQQIGVHDPAVHRDRAARGNRDRVATPVLGSMIGSSSGVFRERSNERKRDARRRIDRAEPAATRIRPGAAATRSSGSFGW